MGSGRPRPNNNGARIMKFESLLCKKCNSDSLTICIGSTIHNFVYMYIQIHYNCDNCGYSKTTRLYKNPNYKGN